MDKDSATNKITLIINGVSYSNVDYGNNSKRAANEIASTNDICTIHDKKSSSKSTKVPAVEWILEDTPPKKRVRHKFPKPDEWEQNRRKRLRQEGKTYVTRRGVIIPEKTFSIKQCNHCSEKCHEHFNKQELQEMFNNFWKLDLQNKRQYISQLIEETKVKRVRTRAPNSRRSITRHYYLIKNSSQRKKVCRGFFLEVFKVSSNFVRTVLKKRMKSGIVEKDLRGTRSPPNKRPAIVRYFINAHINQFRRPRNDNNNTEREYLCSSLTLKDMYEAYVNECNSKGMNPEKYWLYADVFHKDFNLHFRKPVKCFDVTVVKPTLDNVSEDSRENLSPIILEQAVLVENRPSNNSLGALSHERCSDIVTDYKSLYEQELRKTEQLREEIHNLHLLLLDNQENPNHAINFCQPVVSSSR